MTTKASARSARGRTAGAAAAAKGGLTAAEVAGVLSEAQQPPGRLTCVSGPEPGLIRLVLADLLKALRAAVPGLEIRLVDAADREAVTAVVDFGAPTLFGDPPALVVRGLESAGDDVQEALRGLLAAQDPSGRLILTHGGGARGTGVLNAAEKAGARFIRVKKIWEDALPRVLVDHGRRCGGRVTDDAAAAIVAARGTDLAELFASVEQAVADSRDGRVDEACVRATMAGQASGSAFDIADQVLLGDTGAALLGFRRLAGGMGAGSASVVLVAAMSTALRRLAKVPPGESRDLEVARRVGVPVRAVARLRRQAGRWSSPGQVAAVALRLAEADAAVKGGVGDDEALDPEQKLLHVERLIVEIGSAPDRRGG